MLRKIVQFFGSRLQEEKCDFLTLVFIWFKKLCQFGLWFQTFQDKKTKLDKHVLLSTVIGSKLGQRFFSKVVPTWPICPKLASWDKKSFLAFCRKKKDEKAQFIVSLLIKTFYLSFISYYIRSKSKKKAFIRKYCLKK